MTLKIPAHDFTLSYADGTILMGSISAINDSRAALKTSFSEEPLAAFTDGLRQLIINMPQNGGVIPETPIASLDKIVIQQTTLHGKLMSAGDGWPRWLPVGGTTQATPSKEFASEITQAFPADAGDSQWLLHYFI